MYPLKQSSLTTNIRTLTKAYVDAVMAIGMLLLNEKFAVFEELGMQKVAPIIGLGLVVLDFGYILSIFRMKYHGYPYRWVWQAL